MFAQTQADMHIHKHRHIRTYRYGHGLTDTKLVMMGDNKGGGKIEKAAWVVCGGKLGS